MNRWGIPKDFIKFLMVGAVNTANSVVLAYVFSWFIQENIAFALAYAVSLLVAYILNAKLIFFKPLNIVSCVRFCISYIPGFVIQNFLIFILFNILKQNYLFAEVLTAVIGVPVTFLAVKMFAFGNCLTKSQKRK